MALKVFSADMYEEVFSKNPMSAGAGKYPFPPEDFHVLWTYRLLFLTTGKKYRKEILLPGASRDEMDSLKVSRV